MVYMHVKGIVAPIQAFKHENMKAVRKSKGLSQEELAVKLNVVKQSSQRGRMN